MPSCGLLGFISLLRSRASSLGKSAKKPISSDPPEIEEPFVWRPTGADAGRQLNLFPSWPPPAPEEILKERTKLRLHMKEWRYAPPLYLGAADTPVFSLYRLYENVMLDNTIGLRNEIEYFWNHHTWILSELPDPQDEDPARYAMLAGSTGLLEQAFNNKIRIGGVRDGRSIRTLEEFEVLRNAVRVYESVPAWTAAVPSLKETLKIPYDEDTVLDSTEDDLVAPSFMAKNILLATPHIFFI